MRYLRVYLSGPPDLETTEADQRLRAAGFAPYVASYRPGMGTTRLAFLAVCDAIVLLPGYPSEGDQELGIAGTKGIRAYSGVDEFLESQREYL